MIQPNFDYTKPNNLPFHVDNLFVLIFAAITTTSKAATNVLYGNYCNLNIVKYTTISKRIF